MSTSTTSGQVRSRSSKARTPPHATYVVVSDTSLTVTLDDGRRLSVPLDWYPRLVHATPAERNHWKLGAGSGIYWPDLDEDISVEGLIAGKRSMEGSKTFNWWLRQRAKGRNVTLEDYMNETSQGKFTQMGKHRKKTA